VGEHSPRSRDVDREAEDTVRTGSAPVPSETRLVGVVDGKQLASSVIGRGARQYIGQDRATGAATGSR